MIGNMPEQQQFSYQGVETSEYQQRYDTCIRELTHILQAMSYSQEYVFPTHISVFGPFRKKYFLYDLSSEILGTINGISIAILDHYTLINSIEKIEGLMKNIMDNYEFFADKQLAYGYAMTQQSGSGADTIISQRNGYCKVILTALVEILMELQAMRTPNL